jgi:quinol monooxygenase YgiN
MTDTPSEKAKCMHIVTATGKDEETTQKLLEVLNTSIRETVMKSGGAWYEVGLKVGSKTELVLCEAWYSWDVLDKHLQEQILPGIDALNAMMAENFDPAKHTIRIDLP